MTLVTHSEARVEVEGCGLLARGVERLQSQTATRRAGKTALKFPLEGPATASSRVSVNFVQ